MSIMPIRARPRRPQFSPEKWKREVLLKLWIVVTIFGKTAAVSGPLPYDIGECHRRAADMRAEHAQAFFDKNLGSDPRMIVEGRRVTQKDIKVECVEAYVRPELGYYTNPQ